MAKVIDPSELDAEGRVVFGATVDLEEEERAMPSPTRSWVTTRPT